MARWTAAAVAVLAVPASSLSGAGVARAAFGDASATAESAFQAAPDWVAPQVTSSVIAKTAGYLSGWIRQGGTYRVYANVADSGNPASGIGAGGVVADVSAITPGSQAALVAGSYSVGGVAYNYRSAALTAASPLSASQPYSIISTDVGGNSRVQSGYSVGVDNTSPVATDVQTTNAGISGRAEVGDTLRLTYSEQIDPQSILDGWTGAPTNAVVRLVDGGCILIILSLSCADDSVQIWNISNTSQLPLGSVNLKRGDYHGTLLGTAPPITFGAAGTPSTMAQAAGLVTITLGTASATADTAGGTGPMVWSPTASVYDRAGNPGSAASATESGAADKDF